MKLSLFLTVLSSCQPVLLHIQSANSLLISQDPRDVAEVRVTPRFIELHNAIWADLREEVLKGATKIKRNKVKA